MIRNVAVAALTLAWAAAPRLACAQQGDKRGEMQSLRVPREKIPPASPLSPEQALKSFKIQPGYRIEPAASEPMIENPVVMQFDPDGRAWVIEMRAFMPNPEGKGEDAPTGRVSILDDTDGDGRFDKRAVFLDGLVLPRALLPVKGGVLICEPPALWFYPDLGDKAGPRVLVAGDFAPEADPKRGREMSIEHAGNSLVRGLDNWIYSLYHSYRYRQEGDQWVREPMPRRAQWGLAQDDFGRLFYTSNSDHLRGDMVPTHYFGSRPAKSKLPGVAFQVAKDQSTWPARVNPGVNRAYQPDTLRPDGTLARFTAACGTMIYRGDLFGADAKGNAFICEPSGNFVRRNILSEKNGYVIAQNACDKTEFLASTDEIFRPVNLTMGPDGALYVLDMYHGIIQHRVYLTSYLRAQAQERGLEKVTNFGRIWRVLPEGKSRGPKPSLSKASSGDLVQHLSHPNGWWRDTAQRLLVERNDAAAIPALVNAAQHAEEPFARLHALWTLEGIGRLAPEQIAEGLDDPHPKLRAAAVRLAEAPLKSAAPSTNTLLLRQRLLALATDAEPDVQIQLALTLGAIAPDEKSESALAAIAKDSPFPLARDAAAFSIAAHEPATKPGNPAVAKEAPLSEAERKRFAEGRTLYEMTCLACHQQHGHGQPGLAPPLADSEWVAGSDKRLIRIVLNGLRGPVKVKGEIFELDMPALGVLDDEQIASVLTYIRREWGHNFAPVSPATVKAVREETSTREDAWTMPELLRIP